MVAQEEARAFHDDHLGTEHLLLALAVGPGAASIALHAAGIRHEALRHMIGDATAEGAWGSIPFTPRCKKVLELSLREALQLGHSYIGTEHLLLGIIREATSHPDLPSDGKAAQILVDAKVSLRHLRQVIIGMISGYTTPTVAPLVKPEHVLRREAYRAAVEADSTAVADALDITQHIVDLEAETGTIVYTSGTSIEVVALVGDPLGLDQAGVHRRRHYYASYEQLEEILGLQGHITRAWDEGGEQEHVHFLTDDNDGYVTARGGSIPVEIAPAVR